ncbi:hypothetical protein SISSUDRAFT_1057085 [Sistotremastrum suecicum HHB10207 ss-3]|uniref:Mitochondrial escape protein 2 n=1 Tax=Sistotremastrum suecicum HHB10207 ss-3 TaxID=1314776 RepID=A0A166IUI3_9AGAM|nr:hypothetical protein SISSUDRAFT_1057085 [Sistotremastrum suecicum HHB10207 ss-3]
MSSLLWRPSSSRLRIQCVSHREPILRTSRFLQTDSEATASGNLKKDTWLFFDSLFPITLFHWDPRASVARFFENSILDNLKDSLKSLPIEGAEIISIEPRNKDGGAFVHIRYAANAIPDEDPLNRIEEIVNAEISKNGGVPSWLGLRPRGRAWVVRGRPYREDMYRFASQYVKVEFEGPDVHEEDLWRTLRPYGRIVDITAPTPVPAGTLRSSTVFFYNLRSAAIARNVIHGEALPTEGGKITRLALAFERPLKAHAIRDWLTAHPRIVVPVAVFLFGTLTYTIFDPIRALAVQGKMMNWFDYREYSMFQWLERNAFQRLPFGRRSVDTAPPAQGIWKDREEAETAMRSYLEDFPSTISFIHGPQGSGKTRLTDAVIKESGRDTLVIDCAELSKAGSDTRLVTTLAKQTGYWPVFGFLNSINSMLDLISVGLIGKPAGLSSSLDSQLKQILDTVERGLVRVSSSHKQATKKSEKVTKQRSEEQVHIAEQRELEKVGGRHDGRVDVVAGTGPISELGIGDEPITSKDRLGDPLPVSHPQPQKASNINKSREEIDALPIVIIKNFATRSGANSDEILTALSNWASGLVENQVAHVIVLSDNRENAKRLATALPSRPLGYIALSDADRDSALRFVMSKLHESGYNKDVTSQDIELIERLGGRANDLELLIHKVQNGETISSAVEERISRGVGELRKSAFGDDSDDAKSLPWSREQVWVVLKQLAAKDEIPYFETLVEFPFKGDDVALRRMEQAELISVVAQDGRPTGIRPGKPVLKWVFKRLLEDKVFKSLQDIYLNEKIIATLESTLKSCEQELLTLKELGSQEKPWFGSSATNERAEYLLKKMHAAGVKLERLEKENSALKKTLASKPT